MSALDDEDPSTFIALRYDKTHVFFLSSSFGTSDDDAKMFRTLPNAESELLPATILAPDETLWEKIKGSFEEGSVGEHWQLEITANSRIAAVLQRPIAIPWGCSNDSYAAGFIAEVDPAVQSAFAGLSQKSFLIHKAAGAVDANSKPLQARVSALPDWKPSPEVRAQIEDAIVTGLKEEVAHEHDRGAYGDLPAQFQQNAALGRIKLAYEFQAFQLSQDGAPRLFVRARWMVGRHMALLTTMWLRVADTVTIETISVDTNHVALWLSTKSPATSLPEQELSLNQLDSVLNVFDRHDGDGDVLLYFQGYEGFRLYLLRHTDAGFAATRVTLEDGC